MCSGSIDKKEKMSVSPLIRFLTDHGVRNQKDPHSIRCLGGGPPPSFVPPGKFHVATIQDRNELYTLIAKHQYVGEDAPSLSEVMNRNCKYRPCVFDSDRVNVTPQHAIVIRELSRSFFPANTKIAVYVCHSPPKAGAHVHLPYLSLPVADHQRWIAEITKQIPELASRKDDKNKSIGIDNSIYSSGLRMTFCTKGEEGRPKVPLFSLEPAAEHVSKVVHPYELSAEERYDWLERCSVLFFHGYNQMEEVRSRQTTNSTRVNVNASNANNVNRIQEQQVEEVEQIDSNLSWIVRVVREILGDPHRSFSQKRAREANTQNEALLFQFPASPGDTCPSGSGCAHENAAGGYYVFPNTYQPYIRCHSPNCQTYARALLNPSRSQIVIQILRDRLKRCAMDGPVTIKVTANGEPAPLSVATAQDPRYIAKCINGYCVIHKKVHDGDFECFGFVQNIGVGFICVNKQKNPPEIVEEIIGGLKQTETKRLKSTMPITERVFESWRDPKNFIMVRGKIFEKEGYDYTQKNYKVRLWGGHLEQQRIHFRMGAKIEDWYAWLDQIERVDHLVFDPKRDEYKWTEGGQTFYNTWLGWLVEKVVDEITDEELEHECWPILQLIHQSLCDNDDERNAYLLNYFAHLFQKPAEIPGVSLVLQSDQEGTGKGTIIHDLMRKIVPANNYSYIADSNVLESQFNDYMMNCLVCFFDEAFWGGDNKIAGKLRSMITNRTATVNRKYMELENVLNTMRVMIASNNSKVVPASGSDRRFAFFKIRAMATPEFFDQVHRCINSAEGPRAFFSLMMRRDISNWKGSRMPSACVDQSWLQALFGGLDSVQAWLYEELAPYYSVAGHIPNYLPNRTHNMACLYSRYVNHHCKKQKLGGPQFISRLEDILTGCEGFQRVSAGEIRNVRFPARSVLRESFEKNINNKTRQIESLWDKLEDDDMTDDNNHTDGSSTTKSTTVAICDCLRFASGKGVDDNNTNDTAMTH